MPRTKKTTSTSRSKSKKSTTKTKRVSRAPQKQGFWQTYLAHRDDFYTKNPNAEWLIGVLIIVTMVHMFLVYQAYGFISF